MQTDVVIKTGDIIIDTESPPQVLEKENNINTNNNLNINFNMRDKKKNKLSLSEIEESNEIPNFIQLVDDNQIKEQTNSNNVSMKNEIEMIEQKLSKDIEILSSDANSGSSSPRLIDSKRV